MERERPDGGDEHRQRLSPGVLPDRHFPHVSTRTVKVKHQLPYSFVLRVAAASPKRQRVASADATDPDEAHNDDVNKKSSLTKERHT